MRWNGARWTASSRRSASSRLIVAGAVLANALHMVARRRLNIAWRAWLTQRVVGDWMAQARHYQVAQIPGDHDNPDGRIAEDIRIATEYAIDLANSLLYATLLLVTFVGMLWTLSGRIIVLGIDVPGHMVALSFAYAAAGSAAPSCWAGRWCAPPTCARRARPISASAWCVRARPPSPSRWPAARRASADASPRCSTASGPPGPRRRRACRA